MNWPTVALGECVVELRGGASIKGKEFTNSGFPVLHKGTIREGAHLVFERDGKSHVPTEYAAVKPKAIVDSEFVVATFRNLVRTGETLGFMAPVPTKREYLLAQGAYGLKLDVSRLNKRFLSHLSNAWIFHKEVLKRMVGTTQVHIRNGEFLKIPIPLPPLAEQKRIAGILDAADALRTKRSESLAQLDTLLQSTFLDMFGDPVTNPMGWGLVQLRSVAELENGDRSSKYPSGTDVIDSGVLFLSTKNISGSRLVLEKCQFITEEKFRSLSRGKLRRRDLVITLRGTLGSCAIFDCEYETGFINAQILILHPGDQIDHTYLHALLVTARMKNHLADMSTGVAVKQLTGKQIGDLVVALPPAELQQRFAVIVESIEQQKASQRAHQDELDALFASLQSRAFRGDL